MIFAFGALVAIFDIVLYSAISQTLSVGDQWMFYDILNFLRATAIGAVACVFAFAKLTPLARLAYKHLLICLVTLQTITIVEYLFPTLLILFYPFYYWILGLLFAIGIINQINLNMRIKHSGGRQHCGQLIETLKVAFGIKGY